MKVIIVGNGSSLLDKNNGELIDSFDIVVRFNSYTIEKFEKQVGTKTNYWFNTVNFSNKLTNFRTNAKYDRIYWHSWHWSKETDDGYKAFVSHFKDKEIIKTSKDTITEIQNYVKDNTYYSYSTGIIAIWMLLKEYNDITITGFDWWTPNKKHHYNDNGIKGNIHQPDKEYKVIQKLLQEEKIKFL